MKEEGPAGYYLFFDYSCARCIFLCFFGSLQLSPAVCQLFPSSLHHQPKASQGNDDQPLQPVWPGGCNALHSLLIFLCWVFSYGFLQDEITSKGLSQVCNLFEYLTLVVFSFLQQKTRSSILSSPKKTSTQKGEGKKRQTLCIKHFHVLMQYIREQKELSGSYLAVVATVNVVLFHY